MKRNMNKYRIESLDCHLLSNNPNSKEVHNYKFCKTKFMFTLLICLLSINLYSQNKDIDNQIIGKWGVFEYNNISCFSCPIIAFENNGVGNLILPSGDTLYFKWDVINDIIHIKEPSTKKSVLFNESYFLIYDKIKPRQDELILTTNINVIKNSVKSTKLVNNNVVLEFEYDAEVYLLRREKR